MIRLLLLHHLLLLLFHFSTHTHRQTMFVTNNTDRNKLRFLSLSFRLLKCLHINEDTVKYVRTHKHTHKQKRNKKTAVLPQNCWNISMHKIKARNNKYYCFENGFRRCCCSSSSLEARICMTVFVLCSFLCLSDNFSS